MYTTYAVLNTSMKKSPSKTSTILNITSTTALEAPPFSGEAVYHANKALQEGFTNALRNELSGTNIKVLALRPGVVATLFHRQRVGYDDDKCTRGSSRGLRKWYYYTLPSSLTPTSVTHLVDRSIDEYIRFQSL